MNQTVSWWDREEWSGTWTQNITELVAGMEENDNSAHHITMIAPPDFWETVALAVISKTMTAKDFVPPSVALALKKTLDNMLVVYRAHTPKLREILPAEVFEWKPVTWTYPPANNGSSGDTSQTRRQETLTMNATVVLEPVYEVVVDPYIGRVPVFDRYVGSAMVNGTNITVAAWDSDWDGRFTVTVYIDGTKAYTGSHVALPATLSFTHKGARYVVRVEPPQLPPINETISPGLEPFDVVPVPLPDGSLMNVTVYSINETVRLGNVTVVLVGDSSRLGVHLDVMIYWVLPLGYNVTALLVLPNGTKAPVDVDAQYTGHLYLRLYHDEPVDGQGNIQLLPEDTTLRITIQPLGLVIEVPVKG